jgi:hypothetical protein
MYLLAITFFAVSLLFLTHALWLFPALSTNRRPMNPFNSKAPFMSHTVKDERKSELPVEDLLFDLERN